MLRKSIPHFVHQLVGWSVDRLVSWSPINFFAALGLFSSLPLLNTLVTFSTAPAHPHANGVAVYLVLFINKAAHLPKIKKTNNGVFINHENFSANNDTIVLLSPNLETKKEQRTENKDKRTKNEEQLEKNKDQRTMIKDQRTKKKEQRTKNQEPRTKN